MAASITKIGIVNDALQLLGSQSIASLTENSRGAKSMSRAYDSTLLSELRTHTWNFAIKRASLAADANTPLFGKSRAFPLPGDFLFLAPNETTYCDPKRRDWQIEGLSIISVDKAPLEIRYVSSNIPESNFDVLFANALSAALAMTACEELTNSNTKLAAVAQRYDQLIKDAKKRNAIENAPVKAPTCSFITVRT